MRKSKKLIPAAISLAVAASISPVYAQDAEDGGMEEVVTVGTRSAKPRSATDSPAPIDVITGEDFANQGGIDATNLLRNVVPSFNVNDQPISDAGTLVRPANLRGLAPDHTLVLVNGQRRHRGAVITWIGNGISDGSQGADIGAIPSLAIGSVEVLRDGAAAQYGSDAIAGVINFNLKNSQSEGTIELKLGQYSEGDGDQFSIAVNKGFAIGNDGFFNVTAELSNSDATDRSIQRADAQALIDAGFQEVPVNAQIWGTPEVSDDIKLWANFGGIEVGEGLELFGQANFNSKTVDGGFYYRNPTNRGGIYSSDGGTTLLIGDLTPGPVGQDNSAFPALSTGDGVGCPTVTNNPDGTPDAAAFAQVAADPNCFSFQETIPGGFTPRFGGDVTDTSLMLGLRGEAGELGWSTSFYYGEHEADFVINNTVNPSFGPDTPRDFDPGVYTQEDFGLNADFTYAISSDWNVAFGAEYRTEEFTIQSGQVESFTDGGLGSQGFGTSSNGFGGFPPVAAGSFKRENYAIYVDSEWDLTEDLLVTAALRFEDFETFGSTSNYKLGANYSITDTAGIRSTVSTGFKAPTPGQSNASNVTTQINFATLLLENNGTIPSTSPPAVLRGGGELQPEESTSFAIGGYFTIGAVDITIDYFDIDLEDRLNVSENFTLSAADRAALLAQGFDASDVANFRFFTNQFDTNTSGIDLVVSTTTEWESGETTWSFAYNDTETKVTRRDPNLFDDLRVQALTEGVPQDRWNLTAHHRTDNWRFLARVNHYGEFFDVNAGGIYDDANTLDLEVGYSISDDIQLTFGGRNVTDETGCSADDCGNTPANVLGLPSSQFSPFGFNGAFYYLKAAYNF